jgi:hypothetical protein
LGGFCFGKKRGVQKNKPRITVENKQLQPASASRRELETDSTRLIAPTWAVYNESVNLNEHGNNTPRVNGAKQAL